MLHVLAIIGLVALIVVAVIAILVLLFLFFPFRYKVKAIVDYSKEAEEETESLKKLNVKAVIYWLFHFLRIEIRLDKSDFKYKVRLLGIVILGTEKSEKKKLKEREKERKRYNKKRAERQASEAKLSEVENETESENKIKTEKFENETEFDESVEEKENFDTSDEEPEEEIGIFARIKSVFAGIKKAIVFLKDKKNRKSLKLVKDQLFRVLKEVRPRKFKGYASYGTGDPATTGKLLGVIAVFFGVIGRSISVVPDFENKKLIGDFFIKGKFRAFVLLSAFFKLMKDKNIKKVLNSAFSK